MGQKRSPGGKKIPCHGKESFQTSWIQKEDDGNKIGTCCKKVSDLSVTSHFQFQNRG